MSSETRAAEYVEREELLKAAFSLSQSSSTGLDPLSLGALVALMKNRSRAKGFLSSIYFAGAEGDHPFFLKNDKIALGIAVLPEDAPKAGRSKRHPHQCEVIFVLKGALYIEIEGAAGTDRKLLQEGDMFVIERGRCHRFLPLDGKAATYLFVKTNPSQEPRGVDCTL